MIYNWTGYEDIVAILENTYHIKSVDYIYRLPIWIDEALNEFKVKLPTEPQYVERIVNNHTFELPRFIKSIALVTCNNNIVTRTNTRTKIGKTNVSDYAQYMYVKEYQQVTTKNDDDTITKRIEEFERATTYYSSPYSYAVLGNDRLCETDAPDGYRVQIFYTAIPHTMDHTGIIFPMIPDGSLVKQAVAWYVLRSLLYGGYKHPVLDIASPNKYINPALAFEEYAERARGELLGIDRETRDRIMRVVTNFIPDTHPYRRFVTKN